MNREAVYVEKSRDHSRCLLKHAERYGIGARVQQCSDESGLFQGGSEKFGNVRSKTLQRASAKPRPATPQISHRTGNNRRAVSPAIPSPLIRMPGWLVSLYMDLHVPLADHRLEILTVAQFEIRASYETSSNNLIIVD